jgi:hypothetical protein
MGLFPLQFGAIKVQPNISGPVRSALMRISLNIAVGRVDTFRPARLLICCRRENGRAAAGGRAFGLVRALVRYLAGI